MKNKFEIFALHNISEHVGRERGEILVKEAALAYGMPKAELINEKVCRSETGKPFFDSLNIHFSISHSDEIWACVIGPFDCGLDVQYIKPCNFKKIAGRFFSENEKNYVCEHGLVGFFEIWTRREAYGKFTGEGFFCEMPDFVTAEGRLAQAVDGICGGAELAEVFVAKDFKCALCTAAGKMGEIYVREDWHYEDNIFVG